MSDDHDDDEHLLVRADWADIPSAFAASATKDSLKARKAHAIVSKATTAASMGLSATSSAKYLTFVGVGGAAVLGAGTLGLGLAVAGGVMTAVNIGTSARSAYKTMNHVEALIAIEADGTHSDPRNCRCMSSAAFNQMTEDHDTIRTKVLPYIINKKKHKVNKKLVNTGGLSILTAAHRGVKALHKMRKHTKGVNRTHHADILARHTVTHDCSLARDIVAELFSEQDYLAIRQLGSKMAGEILANKMKSV